MDEPVPFKKCAPRARVLLPLALLLVAWPLASSAEPAPPAEALRLSVMPLGTPEEGQKMIARLLNFLEAGLGLQVLKASPSSNLEQYRDALTRRFAIGIVPAQLGGVLIREGGYLPIAAPKIPFTHPGLYVRSESGAASLDALHGKRVATPNHMTITRLRGEADLGEQGLRLTEDVVLVETPSEVLGLELLVRGEVDAALLPEAVVLRLHEGIELRALYRGEPMASLIVIVDGNLDASLRKRIQYLITEPGISDDDPQAPAPAQDLLLRRPEWALFGKVTPEYRAEIERLGEKFAPIMHELSEPATSKALSPGPD